MISKEYFEKYDTCYNKFNSYEHIYCSKCHHSMYFKSNYPTPCNHCGTLVYPTKRSEFKAKIKSKMIRNRGENNE